ncbi:MAG: hypothetical protein JNM28_02900 [Armatimonadetes bacterium]|nr:hypothetical protein [Armatimonadota bacterium]
MAVTNYLSIDGEVLMESGTTEEERIMYIRDGLGSVVATADSQGNVLNTYMYKPSGAVWQKTCSAPDPRFLWCGTWGYRAGGSAWNSHYVRARHYSHNSGAWTTVDPLWPSEPAYRYVGGRAMGAADPSGMNVRPRGKPWLGGNFRIPDECGTKCTDEWNRYIFLYCNWCYDGGMYLQINCASRCDELARDYYVKCKGIPGPGIFAPPPGGGVIAPRRKPQLPKGWVERPEISPYIEKRTTDDCLEEGSQSGLDYLATFPDGVVPPYVISIVLSSCISCCKKSSLGEGCVNECRFFASYLGSLWVGSNLDDLGKLGDPLKE